METEVEGPQILFLDIETQPDVIYAWGVYEQNAIEVKEHWQLLSYSAKWKNGEHITRGLCDFKGYRAGATDEKLVKELWHLLDRADVVVAHNGRDFDCKKINARFMYWGLTPPSPYKIVDTKNEIKKVAGFSSNKLDWLCNQLHLGRKVEHEGWKLWKTCMDGDRKAWKRMKVYNKHDVTLLEKLYKLILPWTNHPNVGLWHPSTVCSKCGSKNLERRGHSYNKTTIYQRVRCQDCGAWMRASVNVREIKPLVGI